MVEPSWRAVAYMLADRLENNDYCHDHVAIADGLVAECPFCQDREAMRVFRSKSGTRRADIEGTLVPVHEIRATGANQQIGAQGGDGLEGYCRGCGDPASKHEGAFCAGHYQPDGSNG